MRRDVTAPEPTATPDPTSTPVPSPTAGEIDIMEFIGREPDHIYGTVHAPCYPEDTTEFPQFLYVDYVRVDQKP